MLVAVWARTPRELTTMRCVPSTAYVPEAVQPRSATRSSTAPMAAARSAEEKFAVASSYPFTCGSFARSAKCASPSAGSAPRAMVVASASSRSRSSGATESPTATPVARPAMTRTQMRSVSSTEVWWMVDAA